MMPMPIHHLFYPQQLAVVGASDQYGKAGRSVFSQLLTCNLNATLIPINAKHKTVGSLKAFADLEEAAQITAIDTVVIIVAADKVTAVVREAIKIGAKQIVVINELDPAPPAVRKQLDKAAELAHKAGVLLLALPVHGVEGLFGTPRLSASAYIGHGEGIADCLENYARERSIEFSRFLPLNPQASYPVSTGRLIDFIANESTTTGLLVHISVLDNARELLSALTAASRRKPVVVLSTIANEHHENLLIQALERQHILVTRSLTDFFTAAKLMHTGLTVRGKRLSIISNSPQIGALTFRALPSAHIEAAQPSQGTQRALHKILPQKPDSLNPLYLPTDAAAGLFQAALDVSLNDEHTDAVMLIFTGRNNADNRRTAQLAIQSQQKSRKPVLLVWLGNADTAEVRNLFNSHRTLHFKQPDQALHALSNLNTYRQQQQRKHDIASFHDYRFAVAAAQEVRKSLRPILPLVSVPASKNAGLRLLEGLRIQDAGDKKTQPELFVNWQNRAPLGQECTLITQQASLNFLPPLTPEQALQMLRTLGLNSETWQAWLLNSCETLSRLTEIQNLQLELNAEEGQIICQHLQLNLQDPDSNTQNAFTPYPEHEETLTLRDGRLAYLRPIRPEDAPLLRQHIENMSHEERYMRFMSRFEQVPQSLLSRLSHPDYQRDYALILHDQHNNILATAHYNADENLQSCEFGVSTAAEMQGQGLGNLLMSRLIQQAREQGYHSMRAEILSHNTAMQKLAQKLGFTLQPHPNDKDVLQAILVL